MVPEPHVQTVKSGSSTVDESSSKADAHVLDGGDPTPDRLRTPRSATEGEGLFHAVWESAADAMVLSNADGVVEAVNPAYCELYGYSEEELVGQDFALIFPEEQRASAMEDYRQAFNSNDIPHKVESIVRRADDVPRHVEVRYAFIMDGSRRKAMLSIIRDVSERKELEAGQRDLLKYKDDFLLAASHDLRSPLTSIKGRAQLLQRRIARGIELDTTVHMQDLIEIERNASRMSALIGGLLDAASLEMGQSLILQHRPADLVALVHRVASAEQHATGDHQLVVTSSADSMVGMWDTDRLERVLENVLSNAINYSPDGGEISIHVSAEEEDSEFWGVVSISDPGLGISTDDLPHVFDRFYRGANVAAYVSGTGIGLASTKQMVEQHGGTITVRSVEGSGSVVTIRLPLATETTDSPESGPAP